MKQIRITDVSFRDGFQSCLGARVRREDFLPAFEAACEAGLDSYEVAGGARFQSPFFYCKEDAFEMMDDFRKVAGPDVNLQTLSRGANVVGLVSQCREIIEMHAKLFQKHGISTFRNFDALNDVRNLDFSGRCIKKYGGKHQVVVTMMALPPGLTETYAHSAQFYCDCLEAILKAEIPYDSVCFKDASGTATPHVVYETLKKAQDMLPKEIDVEFHTHCTGGTAGNTLMAAVEGGADIIDLAMMPVSGGTSHMDILSMWHILRGTQYVMTNHAGQEIDYEKIFQVEEKFKDCLKDYYFGQESRETNPLIVLSPMPGGALTANTQMMRDNNCMHLYNDVIKAMREVVERGGFGTSVTPVSQFYFQQAFANVTQGPWTKVTEGYGKMVLGYFGKTPAKPDPEIVKLASEQLGLKPTTEDVHDINDRNPDLGIAPSKAKLEAEGLATTEENIFMVATCGDKGIDFLKGNAKLMTRMKDDETRKHVETAIKKDKALADAVVKDLGLDKKAAAAAPAPAASPQGPAAYDVAVNGRMYRVDVAPAGTINAFHAAAPAAAAAPAPAADAPQGTEIKAPMPGTVLRVEKEDGVAVASGDTILVLEAMKMEQPVKASVGGTVLSVEVATGDTVEADQVLAIVG